MRLFGLKLILITCIGAGRVEAHVDSSAFEHRKHEEHSPAIRDGWVGITEDFADTLVAHSSSMITGLPVPKVVHTQLKMPDGTPLSTTIIIPYPTDKKRSTVVCRSPYGPFSSNLATLYTGLGFVALMQDDRGTFASGGSFEMFQRANDDGAATLAWVVQQPWSNGEVYTVGISADGMGEIAMILQRPPMLKGQWWGWTTGNGHNFVYPHGAYRQDLLENYMDVLSLVTHGVAKNDIIPRIRSHEAWSQWWYNLTDCRDPSPCHLSSVNFPVVSTAGWWDIFSQTQIDDWNGVRAHSDPAVRDSHVLIVGPLGHCSMALVQDATRHTGQGKAAAESLFVSARLAGEYFSGTLDGPIRKRLGRINLFVMGEFDEYFPKQWWTSLDDWPAYRTKTLYLQNSRSLSGSLPVSSGVETYAYDPANPTPMLGGANIPFVSKTPGCGTADQVSRETREDVVVFDSPKLDADLPVVGRISAKLFISSTANDTDFVVMLSDVTPGWFGSSIRMKSMLVRFGAVRMRWRDSDSVQTLMVPHQVYEVDVDLMTVAYIFPKGHQIRLTVSSAATPFYNANLNTGTFAFGGEPQTPIVAHNSVHFSQDYPSSVSLPVVSIDDIPPNNQFMSAELHDALEFV